MQGNERWPPSTNPSARLRAARAMPQWITARGSALPPPPPPPLEEPPPVEPEYEVIEFPGQQTYSNQPVIRSKEREKKRCDLCGSSAPAVKCMQCVQQNFCYSCDDMYHRHPKRQSHVRKELDGGRPPLPPKGEPPPPPVPPPRRNKRATPRPTPPPPPHLPPTPGPQMLMRESVSPKPGIMGSLKKMIGARPLTGVSHTLDRQTSLPTNSSMIGFHEQQMMNCNGFPDWAEMHRGHRSGSFSALNPPAFGHMMQAQSMAQLNCPSCHGHGMWNPWGGMPPTGTWQSSTFLNRRPAKEEWSESDSDHGWNRERLRRFSTMSARAPKSYGCDDAQLVRDGRKTDLETASHKGGRRRDVDTLSNRGGRKQDLDTISNRGGRKQDFDTMSNRGGRKKDFDTMSLRGGRRSDIESSSFRSQKKYIEDRTSRRLIDDRYRNETEESESSEERESDDDFVPSRRGRKVMSDLEDVHRGRRRSQPPSPVPPLKKSEVSLKKKNKRNERFTDTGRRRSSPISYKYESPSGEENEVVIENGHESNENVQNGIEALEPEAEEEELGPIPDGEWECTHCTFVNEGGTRVCAICCKTSTKPKVVKTQESSAKVSQDNTVKVSPSSPVKASQSKSLVLEEDLQKRLQLDDKTPKEDPPKNVEKTEKMKGKRGTQSPERNRTLTSTGTSPPPQSISTQTYEEAGRKLKRATSLADYNDWKMPQRSASRQSLLSDTQSLKRAGSQPPEYISTLVQKQVKQGLEMVKLLREAEEHQFSAEDLAVALQHCGDGDPILWLQDNWRNMIDTVVTLGTNYGQERKENTVGTISASEAREALRTNDGNVWAAVTECVEQRQRKYGDLLSRGNFSREDIVTALTATHGNVEEAYKELNKNQLKPFLMRIWGPPQGADNDDGDFTKLAHGDMEGRGGKNSEEVSVDLSSDSNYERIQNWLEDHVHSSNKINLSQSMLQLNLGGLTRSESEWRVNSLLNSRSNSTILKNRRTSDIQRYLTKVYNENDKTLLIKSHSISSQNLHVKNDSDLRNPIQQRQQSLGPNKSVSESSKVEKNDETEIETITIKLNPIIVKSEEASLNLQNEERSNKIEASHCSSDESESESESESASETESDESEDISNDQSHDFSNTLKPDNQHLHIEQKSNKDSSSVSQCPSEKSDMKGLSRSDSKTSSESFESVHSSVDDNQDPNDSILDLKQISHNSLGNEKNEQNSKVSFTDPGINDYAKVTIINEQMVPNDIETARQKETRCNVEQSEIKNSVNNVNIKVKPSSSKDLTDSKTEDEIKGIQNQALNTEQKLLTSSFQSGTDGQNLDSIRQSNGTTNVSNLENGQSSSEINKGISSGIVADSNNTTNLDSSMSTNDSEEKFVEMSTDDEIPFIEDTNEHISITIQNALPVATIAEADDSEDDSNFHSSEVPVIINKQLNDNNKLEKISLDTLSQNPLNLIVSKGKKILPKGQTEFYSASKSDSDLNDEQSNDFSEESLDYNEGRHLSPVTAVPLRRDPSLRFSEGNSDKDVSSIPTDSEKELYLDGKDNNLYNENNTNKITDELKNVLPNNHAELLELLRKSLTKEDVVERIVSTLFASVLQASAEGGRGGGELKGEQKLENPTKFAHIMNKQKDQNIIPENHNTSGETQEKPISLELLTNEEVVEKQEEFDKEMLLNSEDATKEEINTSENITNEINNLPRTNSIVLQNPTEESVGEMQLTYTESIEKNEHANISDIVSQNTEETNEKLTDKQTDSNTMVYNPSPSNVELSTPQYDSPTEVEISSSNITEAIPVQDTEEEEESVAIIERTHEEEFFPEREARRLLAEGLVETYQQAEIAVQLKELHLEDDMILAAAKECNSLEAAIAFLQQECQLCAGKYSVKEMVSMLECEHRCCMECADNYFTLQITERSINDCVCPFCKEPDIVHIEEDKALTYFSHLDIFLKGIVKENIHELFQRKLRDRTLMQDPNFKWCVKCSSGYIANPRQKRLMCPDCKAITCAKCMKPWEKEHEKMSCEEYKAWIEQNDPDHQLEKHLDENGVTCPNCRSKYILAKGGCMHLTCPQCKHEFCSGCTKPFLMGRKCTVSEYCEKLGLHSHHPRNCLFYLRDKEPEELEKLLEDNKIEYRRNEESDAKRCGIQMLKETADGLVEGICGYTTLKAGLCRTHYIENLVLRIRLHKVDPVKLLDFGEALQELRRNGKTPPERPVGMSEFNYRQMCFKVIEEEIPLE